jgi:hypothetical protein
MAEKHYMETYIVTAFNAVMGKAKDLARISEMSPRAYQQFERTIVDFTNAVGRMMIRDFKDKGFIPGDTDAPAPQSMGDKLAEEEFKQ